MAAADPTYDRAYVIDKKFQFDIHSIDQAPFRPFAKKRLDLAYQQAPVWMRIRIAPPIPSSETVTLPDSGKLILRVGPHDTNQIEMYELDQGEWRVQTVGDLHPEREKLCADDYYCFTLSDSSLQPRTVYLKIQTYNFLMLDTEVVTLEKLSLVSGTRVKRIFISLTLAVIMLVIGIYWAIQYRSNMTFFFVGIQASILIYLFSIYGFTAVWFPGLPLGLLDALPHTIFIVRTFFTMLTIYAVIKPYCASIFYRQSVFLMLAACVINFVFFLAGYKVFSIQSNLLIYALIPAVNFFGVLKSTGMVKKVRLLLISAFIFYYALLVPTVVGGLFFESFSTFESPFHNLSDWRLNGVVVGMFIFLMMKFEEEHRRKIKSAEINQIRIDRLEADSYAALLSDRNTMIDLLTHDLKNPLGTITFASRALKEQWRDNEAATQKLRHIDLCVNRMNDLIEHVAVSARLDRYEPEASVLNSPAVELIDELIEMYPDQKRFHIAVDPQAVFKVDREMLMVVFGNLINNAYKYGHEGGEITMTVRQSFNSDQGELPASEMHADQVLYFEITNAVGAFGMPDASRVFERYYRHPNSIVVPGMGLGLSLVKAAAAKIGATVDFRHDHDTVTFTVRVPN